MVVGLLAAAQQRRDGEQRVEPAARLVERLADEVRRVQLVERQLALERLVALGERHRARVKPHVDDLRHARRDRAALLAVERHVVDERAMRVVEPDARALLEVLERPDHRDVALLAAPHRQRRAPVALARQRPVDVVLQPAPEAPVLDVLRVPGDLLVGGQQLVATLRRGEVPRRLGVVQQRRRAAPAVRIGVLVDLRAQQPAAVAQVLDEVGVGVLDEAPGVAADALVVRAVEAHRVDDVQPVLRAEAKVVLAERDRRVHEAGAVLGGDEVGEQHGVAALAVLAARDVGKRRLVAHAVDRRAREALEDLHLRAVAEHLLDERLGEHDGRVERAGLRAHVRQLGIDRDGGVGDERPRRRRPHEQLVAALQRAPVLGDGEPHVDGRVLDVLVAERDLVARQRGAAARAVRDDLVAFVQQTLVGDLLQRPPDRFDVRRVERAVGVVEVQPEADPLGQRVPVLEEQEHRLATAGVELRDAVLLDLLLRRDPEQLLDLDLDRQAVAVPAAAALDEIAAHRPKAREDVLEGAAQDVVHAGRPVGRRRALPEDPRRRALAAAQRLAEDVALTPALEHRLLEVGKGLLRVYRARRHGDRV